MADRARPPLPFPPCGGSEGLRTPWALSSWIEQHSRLEEGPQGEGGLLSPCTPPSSGATRRLRPQRREPDWARRGDGLLGSWEKVGGGLILGATSLPTSPWHQGCAPPLVRRDRVMGYASGKPCSGNRRPSQVGRSNRDREPKIAGFAARIRGKA